MYNIITYEQSLALKNPIYIDVRSAAEYDQEKITGALNRPILNDEERRIVGTTYVQESREKAKLLGVQFASPKLPNYFEEIQKLLVDHEVVIYCKTGGYRSSSLVSFLRSLGEKVYQLRGGYKAYRKYTMQQIEILSPQFEYINLTGFSGSGKTEILQNLKELGAQTIDLEGLANHRGSKFGQVGKTRQPSQKDFDSLLYQELRHFNPGPVFIEAESRRIGSLLSPQCFFQAYKNSPHHVLITAPIAERVARIHDEYLRVDNPSLKNEMQTALQTMTKYVGWNNVNDYLAHIQLGDYDYVIAELLVNYYDKCYKMRQDGYELKLENHDSRETAVKLWAEIEQTFLRKRFRLKNLVALGS